jgi:hypothetical protein
VTDFSILLAGATGARVEVAPGDQSPDFGAALSIDEDLFFIVDHFVLQCLPVDSHFDHYGVTKLEIATWDKVALNLRRAAEEILIASQAAGVDGVLGLSWMKAIQHLHLELRMGGLEFAEKLSRFLHEICDKTDRWNERHKFVFVLGV